MRVVLSVIVLGGKACSQSQETIVEHMVNKIIPNSDSPRVYEKAAGW